MLELLTDVMEETKSAANDLGSFVETVGTCANNLQKAITAVADGEVQASLLAVLQPLLDSVEKTETAVTRSVHCQRLLFTHLKELISRTTDRRLLSTWTVTLGDIVKEYRDKEARAGEVVYSYIDESTDRMRRSLAAIAMTYLKQAGRGDPADDPFRAVLSDLIDVKGDGTGKNIAKVWLKWRERMEGAIVAFITDGASAVNIVKGKHKSAGAHILKALEQEGKGQSLIYWW
jgi:hypothetical protein